MLSLLDHPNLVNFIGYCADGHHRFLVYEYMPLGSLEDHLHYLPPDKKRLDWNTRMKIAAGAAKGLKYLHDEASPSLIYRDLNCSNILLGEGYHPKLSDFGLAKLHPIEDTTHVSTKVIGTYGYRAPEYLMAGQLTKKSDVYSFGVVLLEIITGRKAIDNSRAVDEQNLVAWARPLLKDRRKFAQMADPLLHGQYSLRDLNQALALTAMCIHEQPKIRPIIADVVTALTYLASQKYDPETQSVQGSSIGTSTTPVEKPFSATERVSVASPSLTAQNLEIIHDENEGTLSSHEIQTEAAHYQKEKDLNVPEVTEYVCQSSEPASISALSMPSNRATMESVAVIPSAKGDAKAEILSQIEEVPEIYQTGGAAMTNVDHSVSKILECIGTTVRIIAVHGVCGVGKSSVLRALVNNPNAKHEFDLIIWVTVSKNWSTRKIQDQILHQLPPASSNAEPFQILKSKKFLLVLDDVWERIDLQEMGIPDPSEENGSMIILATRELKVCNDMEEIRVVEIQPVSKEEAWKLFHEQVGGVVDLPSIHKFAQGIVEGCWGLPLLIIVTGRALADEKDVSVWEHAFNEFLMPGRDIKSRIEDLIQLLKFSFYRLKSRSLKSCFLYCALFSEDQQINTSEFVNYCIQEGLIAGSSPDAYDRGYDIVDVLLRALFLETAEDGRSIRMRDVMRDLALGILSSDSEGCQFLLATYSKPLKPENASSSTNADGLILSRIAAGLIEPPPEKEWEQSKMMFLTDNKLSTLPEKPSCPKLVALFLQTNYHLRVVPDLFFHNMPVLKVLNLSKTRIKYLPKSISNLESLETLILRDCERLVKVPSEVGSLKLLEVLDLGGSEIIELPEEIAMLDCLSHLEVSFYGSSTNNERAKLPPKLISSLQSLETLSISVYPEDNWWNKSVKSFIKEVSSLKKLTSLSFPLPKVEFLELLLQESASWKEERLTKFKFVVGHDIKFNASRVPLYVELNYALISGQCLRFVNSEKIPDAIVKVLARCSAFYLDHHLDIRRLSEFGIGNSNKLKYCIISECPYLETIVDSKKVTETVFPCLEHLSIHYSWSLACIWEGVIAKGSFAALRTLFLHSCPKLKYVFKSSMLQFISNLKELQVDDCEAIENIISAEEVTESCCISLKSLRLQYLPELVHIWKGAQTNLLFEYISVYDCPQLQQICIDSKLKQTLKEIKAEKDWWDNLVWEENEIQSHFEAIFTPILEGDVHSS
ncbi:hypothetical protein REPUB_Repub20aG0022500 [Reevesia pubescens]